MNRRYRVFFVAFGWTLWLSPWPILAQTDHQTYHEPIIGAQYADIVIDAGTSKVLHATSPDSLRHPASLTKMMTLYLTFQALKSGKLQLHQLLPVSYNAANQAPDKLGLRPGSTISVQDAILSIVTLSANDSAVVLAEALGGDEARFAREMTDQAKALGMMNTNFANPSGLPNRDQVTTARDMATLGLALIHKFPQYYSYFSRDEFIYAGNRYHNHNHLMDKYPGMDGIKTGYIETSGFNLVASAKRGDIRLVGVVFGGASPNSRNQIMAQLLDAGFAADHQATNHPVTLTTTGVTPDFRDFQLEISSICVNMPNFTPLWKLGNKLLSNCPGVI